MGTGSSRIPAAQIIPVAPVGDAFQFAFFGCWNNQCDDGANVVGYRDAVLEHLKAHASTYAFCIVGGDNMYQVSDKYVVEAENGRSTEEVKVKYYLQDTHTSGFNALRQFDKQQFVILGNHDEDNSTYVRQKGKVKEAQMQEHHDRMSVFDTTAVRVAVDAHGSIMACFVFVNTNQSVQELLAGLASALSQLPEDQKNKPIFVVGHEPLISFKWKKKDPVFLDGINTSQDHPLLDWFAEKRKLGYNIMYLCADVHMFQLDTIQHKGASIPMVVSGTGGASPDEVKNVSDVVRYGDNALNIHVALRSYGYTIVRVDNAMVDVKYVNVCPNDMAGTYYPNGSFGLGWSWNGQRWHVDGSNVPDVNNMCQRPAESKYSIMCDPDVHTLLMLRDGKYHSKEDVPAQLTSSIPIITAEALRERLTLIAQQSTEIQRRLRPYSILLEHFTSHAEALSKVSSDDLPTMNVIGQVGGSGRRSKAKRKTKPRFKANSHLFIQ